MAPLSWSVVSSAAHWNSDLSLQVDWPEALLEHPGAAEEWGDTDDRVLFKGRVAMQLFVKRERERERAEGRTKEQREQREQRAFGH